MRFTSVFVIILLAAICPLCLGDAEEIGEMYSINQLSEAIDFLSNHWNVDKSDVMKWIFESDDDNVDWMIREALFYQENNQWPSEDWYSCETRGVVCSKLPMTELKIDENFGPMLISSVNVSFEYIKA